MNDNLTLTPTPWHVVTIRRRGLIIGHQLRIAGGGPGRSKFFGCARFGGEDKSRRAAERMAAQMNLPKRNKRGGSRAGRLLRTSHTRAAGIRFEWVRRTVGPVLRVVATWTDRRGRSHHTSFSVQRNGLEGALHKAIAARTSCGAPMPDGHDLLQRLQHEFETAAPAPANG
jgi:hypothetical protein